MASKDKKPRASAFARTAAKSVPKDSSGEEFDYGKFVVTFKSCNESDNGAFCFTFDGAGKDQKIGERIQWFSTTGKSAHVSGPRIKKLAMILSGHDDLDEYNDFDPEGLFLDSLLKAELDAAAEYLVEAGKAKNEKAATALLETEFVIKVSKGGEKDDGGNFHNADFAVLKDDADAEDSDEEDEGEPESEKRPARAAKKRASKRAEPEEDDDAEDDDAPDSEPESEPAPAPKKKRRAK